MVERKKPSKKPKTPPLEPWKAYEEHRAKHPQLNWPRAVDPTKFNFNAQSPLDARHAFRVFRLLGSERLERDTIRVWKPESDPQGEQMRITTEIEPYIETKLVVNGAAVMRAHGLNRKDVAMLKEALLSVEKEEHAAETGPETEDEHFARLGSLIVNLKLFNVRSDDYVNRDKLSLLKVTARSLDEMRTIEKQKPGTLAKSAEKYRNLARLVSPKEE